VVLHLAAQVGGIGANRKNPGTFLYSNLMMGVHMIEASRLAGVKKFVQIGTICSYPKFTPVPFQESDLWNGYPEETNGPLRPGQENADRPASGLSQQFGFNGIQSAGGQPVRARR